MYKDKEKSAINLPKSGISNNEQSAMDINIKSNDDFFDVHAPVTLTDDEFAYDIWLFRIVRQKACLKGIYRDGIIHKLEQLGYRKRYRDNNMYIFIKENQNIISEVEPHQIKDEVFGCVQEIIHPVEFDYRDIRVSITAEKLAETFLRQSHTIFNRTFLEHLPTHCNPILRDDKKAAYFLFSNGVIRVTSEGMKYQGYETLNDTCIWHSQIIKRDFHYIADNGSCHFARFLRNVTNNEPDRYGAFISAIGYLLHNYSIPSKGQAVIAYDEEITDLKNPMGGTGKGLLANAIKQVRDVTKIDGKKFRTDDKFKFQDITDSTQVVWLDEVNPQLGFDTFHSCLTDGWSIEKKHRDQFYIKPEDSPKTLICCNSVLKGGGTTNKRRQFVIELSNHYSKQIKCGAEEPIVQEHGCIFFDNEDWNSSEWNMFFSFMLDCTREYLQAGLKGYNHRSLLQNTLRQTTNEDFCEWVKIQNFQADVEYETEILFKDFRETYYGEDSDIKQRGFTNMLKKYAAVNEMEMKVKRSNGIQKVTFKAASR